MHVFKLYFYVGHKSVHIFCFLEKKNSRFYNSQIVVRFNSSFIHHLSSCIHICLPFFLQLFLYQCLSLLPLPPSHSLYLPLHRSSVIMTFKAFPPASTWWRGNMTMTQCFITCQPYWGGTSGVRLFLMRSSLRRKPHATFFFFLFKEMSKALVLERHIQDDGTMLGVYMRKWQSCCRSCFKGTVRKCIKMYHLVNDRKLSKWIRQESSLALVSEMGFLTCSRDTS